MNNGQHHLYGDWDYESNYSDGPSYRNRKPLYKHFGYGSPKQMKEAQKQFAKACAGVLPNQVLADFEVLT